MEVVCALLGVVTAFATHHFAMAGNVSLTVLGCFGMYILYDTLKER